jgi:hypothetical protein
MNEAMKIEVNAMLGDILSCPLNSEAASLYVIMEGIRYSETPAEQKAAEKTKIQEFTVLYKMAPGQHGGNAFAGTTVFERKTLNSRDTGDPHLLQRSKSLGKILGTIPCAAHEEILLITWDHGSAFGIFRDEDPRTPTAHVRTAITDHLEHYPFLQRFWNEAMQTPKLSAIMEKKSAQPRELVVQVKHDLYTIPARKKQDWHHLWHTPGATIPLGNLPKTKKKIPEILKNWELAASIKSWLRDKGQKKVGVLVMLNCWMMNLHTLYNFRKTVKYLVAPEGSIDNPGYNYHDILLHLYGSRPTTPRELSVKVVETSHNELMVERAKKLNKTYPETLSFRSIVNVRLDYGPHEPNELEELFASLYGFIGTLDKMLKADRSGKFLLLLQHVRALSYDFTTGLVGMVDLPNYLFNLIAATNGLKNPVFKNAFDNEVNRLQAKLLEGLPVVLPRWIGDRCYYWNHEPIYTKLLSLKPTGFAIFFPNAKQIDPLVLDNVRDDLLLNEYFVRWKHVLDKIHGGKRLP